jgi:hypothetical protein
VVLATDAACAVRAEAGGVRVSLHPHSGLLLTA